MSFRADNVFWTMWLVRKPAEGGRAESRGHLGRGEEGGAQVPAGPGVAGGQLAGVVVVPWPQHHGGPLVGF